MQKNTASETAEGVAAYRAIESKQPESHRVIYDPYAHIFLGDKWGKMVSSPFLNWLGMLYGKIKFPGFYASVIARVRFINECVKECFPDDFKQLVILGAGYDMSAFCFQDILSNAHVFEVDHPITQEHKMSKINERVKTVPDNITYVPINFESDDLKEVLIKAGYQPSLKTLFIWEGVVYYLEKETIQQTLNFIVDNSAQGSKVAFDYLPPEVVEGTSNDRLGKEIYHLVQKIGEPYKFGISTDDVDDFLKDLRFTNVRKCSSSEIRDSYFNDKRKKSKVSDVFNFVCATT